MQKKKPKKKLLTYISNCWPPRGGAHNGLCMWQFLVVVTTKNPRNSRQALHSVVMVTTFQFRGVLFCFLNNIHHIQILNIILILSWLFTSYFAYSYSPFVFRLIGRRHVIDISINVKRTKKKSREASRKDALSYKERTPFTRGKGPLSWEKKGATINPSYTKGSAMTLHRNILINTKVVKKKTKKLPVLTRHPWTSTWDKCLLLVEKGGLLS